METALEYILTNSYKADMIAYLKSHPKDFNEAIQLAISDKQPYSWRAAWLLWSCIDKNDQRIQIHIKDIVDAISTKIDNQKCELIVILLQMELDEEYEGILYDLCIDEWRKTESKPALRYNAFMMLIKIAEKHPDLSHEVILLTQNQYMNSLSETVKRAILKMVNKLQY